MLDIKYAYKTSDNGIPDHIMDTALRLLIGVDATGIFPIRVTVRKLKHNLLQVSVRPKTKENLDLVDLDDIGFSCTSALIGLDEESNIDERYVVGVIEYLDGSLVLSSLSKLTLDDVDFVKGVINSDLTNSDPIFGSTIARLIGFKESEANQLESNSYYTDEIETKTFYMYDVVFQRFAKVLLVKEDSDATKAQTN